MSKKPLILALSILCLASCGGGNAPSGSKDSERETIQVTDLSGRTVTVAPGSYKKIVCIGAGALRLYSYIGDASKLAGVEDIENDTLASRPQMFDSSARPYHIVNKETYRTLPSCGVGGPNAQSAEAEKILSCDPDLIFSEYEDVGLANALSQQVNVPVITLSYGSNGVFDDRFLASLNVIGKTLGLESKAETLKTFILDQKNQISERTKDVAESDKKSFYICGLGNWGSTNLYMTAQNYEPFNVAHIKNAVTDFAKDGIQKIEKEKLVALGESIDVMILDAAAIKNIKSTFQDDKSILESVKAWNDGEVYLEMAYNAYYTNCEIALANTWYAAKIAFPSLFTDVDMTAKTNEITTAFLGKGIANEIFSFGASFGGYQKIDTGTFFK